MAGSYIVAGARTPIGKMSGALSSFSAAQLGGFAIKAALERAGVKPEDVEHVIMGQVLTAGQGQVPSRQAASLGGIPMNVPSININKVCLSGLNSIYLADQMIASGEADIVIAGGMESMTNAPYLAMGARSGFRFGDVQLLDAIQRDGLWCAFDACLMGLGTERYAAGDISRDVQDDLAMKSNQRAAAAIAAARRTTRPAPGRCARWPRQTRSRRRCRQSTARGGVREGGAQGAPSSLKKHIVHVPARTRAA
jgi:acetyl-CoA C-acetyltransferase